MKNEKEPGKVNESPYHFDKYAHLSNANSSDEFPPDLGEGYSEDVLIDVDGWRKNFRVGWYDHENKLWFIYDDTNWKVKINKKHMKWFYLPLASKDKKLKTSAPNADL